MFRYRIAILLPLFLLTGKYVMAQPKTSDLLRDILAKNDNPILKKVLADPATFRYQIVYTQINRNRNNKPTFKNYYYNYDPYLYFNPASTVKMTLAFLALEKLHEMEIPGVDKYTTIQFDNNYKGQISAYSDATSETGLPSIAHYIKKAFLISDNDAYNRLYQFIGQENINMKLHEKGYKDARITRQFMGFTEEENRHTNQVRFLNKKGETLYTQPDAYSNQQFDFGRIVKLGNAHLDSKDKLVNEPFDFTKHNNITLGDYQEMLQSIIFPTSVPAKQRFNISEDDRMFLLQFLSQYPSETTFPKYDTAQYYDSYVKFFFSDKNHEMPAHVRVFNKVGWAYGFATDIAYVADYKNNVEFMLAATVYVNSDGVLNDGKYEYETIGNPFLYQVGQSIYNYELNRKRKHRPNLSNVKIQYEVRDQKDNRPSIKNADN